jgi:hypothetical protein
VGGCNAFKSRELEIWGRLRSPPPLPDPSVLTACETIDNPHLDSGQEVRRRDCLSQGEIIGRVPGLGMRTVGGGRFRRGKYVARKKTGKSSALGQSAGPRGGTGLRFHMTRYLPVTPSLTIFSLLRNPRERSCFLGLGLRVLSCSNHFSTGVPREIRPSRRSLFERRVRELP